MAFERVYNEGRWTFGADGANSCLSGWSDIGRGQAKEALRSLSRVVEQHDVRSYIDVPVGDGCFSSTALASLREKVPAITYTGLDIVKQLVAHNLVKQDNRTRLMQADVATLTQLPPADMVFSRQMMQHVRRP